MTLTKNTFASLLAIPLFMACQQNDPQTGSEPVALDSKQDTISYALGVSLAGSVTNLREEGVEIDLAYLKAGIDDALGDAEPLIASDDCSAILNEHIQKIRTEKWTTNLKEGETFLAENGQKDGVVTTESGLQYTILNEGSGPKPAITDKVKTHYHGTFLDGKVFDSSVDRGEPVSFPVNGVIRGWTEALQLMPVGAKWKLFVPSSLAYGPRGAGQSIPPHATLIFEVELLEIEK